MKTAPWYLNVILFLSMSGLLMPCNAFCQNADYKRPFGQDSTKGNYVNIRGIKMYYEEYGKGEPILFIHGNGGSIASFTYQIPHFERKYKLILGDNRSQGRSRDPNDSLSFEMMADDYAALLDKLNMDSVNVIGWSDGGIIAILLALRHPSKVKKMAFTGANLQPDSSAVFPDVLDIVRPGYERLQKMVDKTPSQARSFKLNKLLIEQPHISFKSLHAITAPTLVIGGDHDVIRPIHTLQIADNIPNAYLWILPNSGHSVPVNFFEIFNTTIDHFFEKPFRLVSGNKRFN